VRVSGKFSSKKIKKAFYVDDRDKPPHIHVERENKVAKIRLDPIRLQRSGGFSRSEIGRVQKLVRAHQAQLLEVWNEYFRGISDERGQRVP
jgi:hypothetical protein